MCARPSAATVVRGELSEVVRGGDALTPPASWQAMQRAVRNLGKPGVVAEAISAVDIALWDLHARLLDLPLSVARSAIGEQPQLFVDANGTYGRAVRRAAWSCHCTARPRSAPKWGLPCGTCGTSSTSTTTCASSGSPSTVRSSPNSED
nr:MULTISPECIES: hypothetical protein [unclassified Actinopolyspora]